MKFIYKPPYISVITKLIINVLENHTTKFLEYQLFYINLLHNFISFDISEALHIIFINKRLNFTCYKFLYKLKQKIIKNTPVTNEYTLYSEPLIDEVDIVYIYDDTTKWGFTCIDIIKLIENNLLYTNDLLELIPKPPENPYTRKPFSYKQLVYIFDFLSCFKLPLILNLYRNCNFNLNHLLNEHSNYIHNIIIKNNIRDIPIDNILYLFKEYLLELKLENKINFDIIMNDYHKYLNNIIFILLQYLKTPQILSLYDKYDLFYQLLNQYPELIKKKRFLLKDYNYSNFFSMINNIIN
tara:strand:- start:3091 stop:3981 length:891 start_codon:yes stop_codon:yes gene_type:complete